MLFSSILAEAKAEKAPARKSTPKVKSAPARKRETLRATSTASPAFRVAKRTVAKHPPPIADAPTTRPTTPAQGVHHLGETLPCRPLPNSDTIVRDTNRSAKPVEVTIAELLAPHPLAVQQERARKVHGEAAQEAAAKQQFGQQRRRDPRRRQLATSRAERHNAPRPQQRQLIELPQPYVPKAQRPPKRQSKLLYENMSQRELLDEAQSRELELDSDYKGYLVEVLVVNDKAYFELMEKLGDHFGAVEFAQGEVKHHNKELRRKRVEAKAAVQQAKRERAEAHATQQQTKGEAGNKMKTEECTKAAQLVFEKKEAEKKAVGMKQAAKAPKLEQKRKRRDSQNTDSGYSSKPSFSPGTGENSNAASTKSKKRARSNDDETEDNTPKKVKVSKPSQPDKAPSAIKHKHTPTALPQAMQACASKTSSVKDEDVLMSGLEKSNFAFVHTEPAKKTTKKAKQVNASTTVPWQTRRRQTRSTFVVKDEKNEVMKDADEDAEDEDSFVVDDGYKPKRKSKVSAQAVVKLFAGMR